MLKPDDTLHLFQELDQHLIDMLESLSEEDWQRQTVARLWKVKDVVAHLVDGALRRVSLHRDGWSPAPASPIRSNSDLVGYLNELNASWVGAARRLSPAILIDLYKYAAVASLTEFTKMDPDAPSVYPVSWAGESASTNRFDIAREYTERWLHQQQIRDAMGDNLMLRDEYYRPALQIFLRAWPFILTDQQVPEGTSLKLSVTGVKDGEWYAIRTGESWSLEDNASILRDYPDAKLPAGTITISGTEAWKLFTKSKRKEDLTGHYTITGNEELSGKILDMISVMA